MSRHFVLALVATLVAGGIATADPVAVINPGFELDENDDGVPDGWKPFIHGEGFDLGATGEVSYEGQRAARLTGLWADHRAHPDHCGLPPDLRRSW